MTTNFNPRLYVENGAAIAADVVHKRHLMIRAALAVPKSPPVAANSDEPVCGTIRFAL